MARQDRTTVRAQSAYMTEYTSFNVLDEDHHTGKTPRTSRALTVRWASPTSFSKEEVV